MIEKSINNIGDFLNTWRIDRELGEGAAWFRGHADSKWPLLPSFLRTNPSISENTLLSRFKQSAAMLADNRPQNSFDWTFLMQHYGVPTRLLDWSESPLVGLYFAVEGYEKHPATDAALWCLWPTRLNKQANIMDKSESDYIPSFDDDEMNGYSIESLRNSRFDLLPAATIATRNNPRIQAQLGTFTIHHNKKVAIEEIGSQDHVIKYNIPNENRSDIFNDLKLLGVNKFSLFPELASVGAILKEMVK